MASELKKLNFKLSGSFDFEYTYSGANNVVGSDYALHLHDKIEIIVLLGGAVDFMVDGEVYSLLPCDALVIKPNVLHHCVGKQGEPFEYLCFWLNFEAEPFLPLLSLDFPLVRQKNERELLEARACYDYFCHKNVKNDLEGFSYAVRLLAALSKGGAAGAPSGERLFSGENAVLCKILKDIHLNYTEISSAKQLAGRHFISLSTLNRLFIKLLHASPGAYLKARKLAGAKNYLLDGASPSEAAELAGLSKSSFMRSFKARFGYTPSEYKKNYERI